jgi:hypothetical protein
VNDNEIKALLHNVPQVNSSTYAAQLEIPITTDETHNALRAGARHRTPGIDGLSLEFYAANWDTIRMDLTELINHIFLQKRIPSRLKHGIIISLPKHTTAIPQMSFAIYCCSTTITNSWLES